MDRGGFHLDLKRKTQYARDDRIFCCCKNYTRKSDRGRVVISFLLGKAAQIYPLSLSPGVGGEDYPVYLHIRVGLTYSWEV